MIHRKLFPAQDSNQTTDCSDCGPNCTYDCGDPEFYWPPEPSPFPPLPDDNSSSSSHISPYVIIIITLLGGAFLFTTYYLIMVRYCARFRRSPAGQVNGEAEEFFDEEHGPEVDHPIWYITTTGLQPAVINSITVVKFKKGDSLIDGTDCSVCLSEFHDGETLRLLPKCSHAFHIPCIDTWLRSHTNCPLCRAGILSTANLGSNDQNNSNRIGPNQNTQMGNQENEAELDGIGGFEVCENRGETGEGDEIGAVEEGGKETEGSKTENESNLPKRRWVSMDSATEIIHTGSEWSSMGSNLDLQSSNHGENSRTRRLMSDGSSVEQSLPKEDDVPMRRSHSYGGR